jgi:hypothetical protein
MKEFMAKLALSTAIVAGSAMIAHACPQTTAMGKDNTATFQLAQAGGGAGGGTAGGGTGTAPGSSASTPGSANTATPGRDPGAAGSGARPVIPPDQPMRDPATPQTPGSQTSPTTR